MLSEVIINYANKYTMTTCNQASCQTWWKKHDDVFRLLQNLLTYTLKVCEKAWWSVRRQEIRKHDHLNPRLFTQHQHHGPQNTAPYRTLQDAPPRTVPYPSVPYHILQYRTMLPTFPYLTVHYRTPSYRTITYRTVPYPTLPYPTLPYHIKSIPHTKLFPL